MADDVLRMQMVPAPLWGRNLRAILPQNTVWRELRAVLLAASEMTCATCGKKVTEGKALKAHEEWVYFERVDPAVAWLRRVSLLCFHCHAVEHPGALHAMIVEGSVTDRARTDTIAHFCAVNGVPRRRWHMRLATATNAFRRRSEREWYVDYGPFTDWMLTRYALDPLNEAVWSDDLLHRRAMLSGTPTMHGVVATFPTVKNDTIPASRFGAAALLFEYDAERKAAERKYRREKKARAARKAARERATAAARASSGC